MQGRASAPEDMQALTALAHLDGSSGKCAAQGDRHGGPGVIGLQAVIQIEEPEGVSLGKDKAQSVGSPKLRRRSDGRRSVRPYRGIMGICHTAGAEVHGEFVRLAGAAPAGLGNVDNKLPIRSHCR